MCTNPQSFSAPAGLANPTADHRKRLIAEFVDAFGVDDLRELVRTTFNQPSLDQFGRTENIRSAVLSLFEWASARGGWIGPLLGAAREANPAAAGLYEFAEDFGLAAARPEDDRRIRDMRPDLDIDAWRSRLGEVEGWICSISLPGGRAATGFLVGPDLVLTSRPALEELIERNEPSPESVVMFDYKRFDNGVVWNGGLEFRLAREWLVDPGLPWPSVDEEARYQGYALIRLEGSPGDRPVGWPRCEPDARPRGWLRLAAGLKPVPSRAPLLSAYYAGRGPCRLGIDAIGAGRSPNGELLFYRQNAIPGSAGAPVFDLEMDLVALNIGPDMMISGEEQRVAVGQRPTAFLERIRELGIVLPEPPGRSAGSPSPLPSSQV